MNAFGPVALSPITLVVEFVRAGELLAIIEYPDGEVEYALINAAGSPTKLLPSLFYAALGLVQADCCKMNRTFEGARCTVWGRKYRTLLEQKITEV